MHANNKAEFFECHHQGRSFSDLKICLCMGERPNRAGKAGQDLSSHQMPPLVPLTTCAMQHLNCRVCVAPILGFFFCKSSNAVKHKNDGAERGDKGAGGCVGGGLSWRTKTKGHTSDFFHPFLVSCLHSKCFPSPLLLAHSLFLCLLKRSEVVRLNLYHTSLTAQMQQISSAELTQSMLIQKSTNRYFIPKARFAVFLRTLVPSALSVLLVLVTTVELLQLASLKVQTAHTSR